MEDMHIHLRKGITDNIEFNKYIEKCKELNIEKVVFLEHGNRISPKHKGILVSNKKILEFNNMIDNYVLYNNDLIILKGIEIDYSKNEHFRKKTKTILENFNFEWIVGAVHHYKTKNLEEYLHLILDMIENYRIDVVAHIKLNDEYLKNSNLISKILKKCHTKNIKIEINTSDRSRWDDEQLYFMLKNMEKYKVRFTYGSDAHSISEIGYNIAEVEDKVKKWKNTRK